LIIGVRTVFLAAESAIGPPAKGGRSPGIAYIAAAAGTVLIPVIRRYVLAGDFARCARTFQKGSSSGTWPLSSRG
jgi:hypothetical protein